MSAVPNTDQPLLALTGMPALDQPLVTFLDQNRASVLHLLRPDQANPPMAANLSLALQTLETGADTMLQLAENAGSWSRRGGCGWREGRLRGRVTRCCWRKRGCRQRGIGSGRRWSRVRWIKWMGRGDRSWECLSRKSSCVGCLDAVGSYRDFCVVVPFVHRSLNHCKVPPLTPCFLTVFNVTFSPRYLYRRH